MHPTVYSRLVELMSRYGSAGPETLEVGAAEGVSRSFARIIGGNYTGISLANEAEYEWGRIVHGNGNCMTFSDSSFDNLICNAMLEHDHHFWMTLAEIRRVLRPGGLFYCGVPGFPGHRRHTRIALGFNSLMPRRFQRSAFADWLGGVGVYPFHAAPDDYYRFSEQAVRKIFFEGFEVLELGSVLRLPRVIGVGRRVA